MSALSLVRRRMPACLAWLVVPISFLGISPSSPSQSVTADFADRNGSTAEVPSGLFSVGGAGQDVTDQGSIGTLTSAGLTGTRFWIPLDQIYATSTPNFSYLDKWMETIKSGGLHPLGVIYNTPPSLASTACAAPSDKWRWGQMAASVVAHMDQKFPGLMQDYEIWNEPELPASLCVADATARLNDYVSMFGYAASAMHAQAKADGQTIRTGGPVISQLSQAATWFPALLDNASAAPYVDFVSFHLYITGQKNIDDGMQWSDLYSITQSSQDGLAYYYQMIESLVRAGQQPNAATTPIYLSEYNNNWAYSLDCCRNDPTFGPLWNSLAITDFLNVIYSGSTAVLSRLVYFNSSGNYFCILGAWDAEMDCDPSQMYPYPQYYAFQLFASPNYLNLQAGGNMAASVSPGSTTSGLSATAFYTNAADNVVVVNPTSASFNAVNIAFVNPGLSSPTGTQYLLNVYTTQIASQGVSFSPISGGYSATVSVPAYSTIAVSMQGNANSSSNTPTAVLNVSPQSGTHPLVVNIDSSGSQGGRTPIVGRTISFGDGMWLDWVTKTTYTFDNPGTYTILLTVKNAAGYLASTSKVITVN